MTPQVDGHEGTFDLFTVSESIFSPKVFLSHRHTKHSREKTTLLLPTEARQCTVNSRPRENNATGYVLTCDDSIRMVPDWGFLILYDTPPQQIVSWFCWISYFCLPGLCLQRMLSVSVIIILGPSPPTVRDSNEMSNHHHHSCLITQQQTQYRENPTREGDDKLLRQCLSFYPVNENFNFSRQRRNALNLLHTGINR